MSKKVEYILIGLAIAALVLAVLIWAQGVDIKAGKQLAPKVSTSLEIKPEKQLAKTPAKVKALGAKKAQKALAPKKAGKQADK